MFKPSFWLFVLALALRVGCGTALNPRACAPDAPSPAPLRVAAQSCDLLIGTAVDPTALRNDPQYRQILARDFSIVTPENA